MSKEVDDGVSLEESEENSLLLRDDERDYSGGYGVITTAVFNVAAIAGTGVLVLPNALAKTGWSGLAVIAVMLVIQTYTGIILGRCWTMLQDRFEIYRHQTRYPYPAIGYEAFGKIGRVIVTVTINVTIMGLCVVFLLLITENITMLINIHHLNKCVVMAIVAMILCPFTWLGTPKDFWQIAVCGAVTTGLSSVLILTSILREIPQNGEAEVTYNAPSYMSYFAAVGIIVVAFNGHPAYPTIQHDMKNPTKFPISLILASCVVSLYFLPLSIAGYYVYGSKLLDVENIFEVVNEGVDSTISLVLITLHVVSAFFIYGNPLFQEVEEIIGITTDFSWGRIATRTSLVVGIWFLAASIPSFSSILSLLGGTTLLAITLIYPVCCYWKLKHTESITKLWIPQYISTMERVILAAIFVMAVVISISTTYANLSSYDTGSHINFTRPCYIPPFSS